MNDYFASLLIRPTIPYTGSSTPKQLSHPLSTTTQSDSFQKASSIRFSGKSGQDLKAAAKRGDLDRVKELVTSGASPSDCSSAFRGAAGSGHTSIVKYLAQQKNLNPDQTSVFSSETALVRAVNNQDTPTTLLVLKAGANPKQKKAQTVAKAQTQQKGKTTSSMADILGRAARGESLMAITAKYGNAKTAQDLMDLGESPNGNKTDAIPPLVIAGSKGNLDMMTALLDHGATPNLPDRTTGENAILKTALAHKVPTIIREHAIRRLHAEGGNLDHPDNEGTTPILASTQAGRASMVDLLAQLGADVNVKNYKNKAAQDYTERGSTTDNVLQAHLSRKNRTLHHTITLHNALRHGKTKDAQKILDESTINPDWQNDERDTVLTLALRCQSPSVITEQILALRPNVKIPGKDHRTALFWSAYRNQSEQAYKLLKEHQADPNITDFANVSPLMWAASHGNFKLVDLLIQRGAQVSHKDNQGETATAYAKHNGHFELARQLESATKTGSFNSQTAPESSNSRQKYTYHPGRWASETSLSDSN